MKSDQMEYKNPITKENIIKTLKLVMEEEVFFADEKHQNEIGVKRESWDKLTSFLSENKLIKRAAVIWGEKGPNQREGRLEITNDGINYIAEEERISETKKHDRYIKWSTVVAITLTAVATAIAIWQTMD